MNHNPSKLLPTATNDALGLMQQALALSDENPVKALTLLQESARNWLWQDDKRRAAFVLHRRASLCLKYNQSPLSDLAMAARLLADEPEARAVVLLDLGQALAQENDLRRARLTLAESEKLARQVGNPELTAAARHALANVATDAGDFASARAFLHESSRALIYDIESDLLNTLSHIGNLPDDPRAERERARRAQAVEDELAALKREMGLA
ncbi:MAG: hypothetical protein ACPGWR_28845 [Ardenticatenaceae bacterium]